MERGDRMFELVIGRALDRLAAAVDAIDIAIAHILRGVVGIGQRAFVNALPGLARRFFGETFVADKPATFKISVL